MNVSKSRFYRQEMLMEPSARLFHCEKCHKQVVICSSCDRGNIYCQSGCNETARKESLRLAGKKYQASFNGKHNHAARQHRYRQHQSEKVTHQGSQVSLDESCLSTLDDHEKTQNGSTMVMALCCHFCKKSVSVFLRNDYLRRHEKNKGKNHPFVAEVT